jgi:hypothetical protein
VRGAISNDRPYRDLIERIDCFREGDFSVVAEHIVSRVGFCDFCLASGFPTGLSKFTARVASDTEWTLAIAPDSRD